MTKANEPSQAVQELADLQGGGPDARRTAQNLTRRFTRIAVAEMRSRAKTREHRKVVHPTSPKNEPAPGQ